MAESHVCFGHGRLMLPHNVGHKTLVEKNEQIDMICSRHGTHRFTLCHVDGGGLSRVDEAPWYMKSLDGMKRSSLPESTTHSVSVAVSVAVSASVSQDEALVYQ